MVNILYYTYFDTNEQTFILITTEEKIWNQKKCIDDGEAASYNAMEEALEQCGADRLCISTFGIELPIENIIQQMKQKGFNFIQNSEFTEFLKP